MGTIGRRLPDTRFGDLPLELDELKPGDYWNALDDEGQPMSARAYCNGRDPESPVHGNLTDTVWWFYSPDGNGLGFLTIHTVREEEDGTISIRPGDGSSNSVLHHGGAQNKVWHGYVEHGEWMEC